MYKCEVKGDIKNYTLAALNIKHINHWSCIYNQNLTSIGEELN